MQKKNTALVMKDTATRLRETIWEKNNITKTYKEIVRLQQELIKGKQENVHFL